MAKVDQRRFDNPSSKWLTARQAAARLGVKLQTLYAYASRGLVTSARGERGRPRLYSNDDIARLKARHDARAGHGPVAGAALRWGEPVLDSSLTAIGPRGPCYRGHAAIDLARSDTPFEAVADLLWTDAAPDASRDWPTPSMGVPAARVVSLLGAETPPIRALYVLLAVLAAREPAMSWHDAPTIASRARSTLRRIAAALALPHGLARARAALEANGMGEIVAVALGARGVKEAGRAINRALVVIADHELNASSFAARVCASTGADLHACLLAACSALSGPRHGGVTAQVEALVFEAKRDDRAAATLRSRAARGDSVPGFGHPLYRDGDPRTAVLLETARELAPREPRLRTIEALVEAAADMAFGAPTVDIGLVALSFALGLGPGAALCIFAAGRSAGWVAHAIEQYEAGFLLRPRARYVGRPSGA